ncbi:MAG: AAA family ATPase [Clostridiales bacterium]|nr:AAA family ATPase [Clostridiales bacterium]
MIIKRDNYLNKLISSKHINLIKAVTGIRRSGKSFLLDPIFTNYLKETGVKKDHIIKIDLDDVSNYKFHDPQVLGSYIRKQIIDDNMYYIILDEIQFVSKFESLLKGLLKISNVDVYVAGSNSKFLSADIITEFRGRSQQIRIHPLSFKEFYESNNYSKQEAYNIYIRFGGMPLLNSFNAEEEKAKYLKDLFELTYFRVY